jgi:hypothetical protein
MTQAPVNTVLKGIVEADETYLGGREPGKRGMPNVLAGSKKTPVLALVERGGSVRSFPMERVTSKTIQPILEKHIDPKSHLVTDESTLYISSEELFPDRRTVNHKAKEYVRHERDFTVTTNTVESFFALLKRSNYGIHHHMSRKYLASYCAEREFVYNGRKLTDDERTTKAIRCTEGKRLMLKRPKNGQLEMHRVAREQPINGIRTLLLDFEASAAQNQPNLFHQTRPEESTDEDANASYIDLAEQALHAHGTPLHINALIAKMGVLRGSGTASLTRTRVESSLVRHYKNAKQPRILKFGPSLYGLPAWKENSLLLSKAS